MVVFVGSVACEAAFPDAVGPDTKASTAMRFRPIPEGSFEGRPNHLLQLYAEHPIASPQQRFTWQLPFQAKRIVVELLTLAARDDASGIDDLLTEDARFGLPDRRELLARPVFDDDHGQTFFDALRDAAVRFDAKAAFSCPPLALASQQLVQSGVEPMWCFYTSGDHLDLIVFKLVLERGHPRIAYVGLFEQRPERPVIVTAAGQPPPLTPPIRRG